jgi:hypothetical protein
MESCKKVIIFDWLESETDFECSKKIWIKNKTRIERQIYMINSIFEYHRSSPQNRIKLVDVENKESINGYLDLDEYYMDVVESYIGVMEKDCVSEYYGLFKKLDIDDCSFHDALTRLQEPKYIDKYIKKDN